MAGKTPPAVIHNRSRYNNYGCRCPVCKKDHAAYYRDYRRRRMARTGEHMRRGRFIRPPLAAEPLNV